MQDKRVIIFVSDDNYIDHVKSIAVNCRVHGNYDGDFAVICPKDSLASKVFKEVGFHVLETDAIGFLQKFYVFDSFFKQFQKCLYLDCDVIVQDDLNLLFDILDKGDLWMDTEDGKIIEMFFRDTKKQEHPEIYEWMNIHYPHVNTHRIFNTAFILFNPLSIEDNTVDTLITIQGIIHLANNPNEGGNDQPPINLLLWHKIKPIPHKFVCFWGCAEPVNNIVSEWRGWVGNETIVAVHYSRWYSQWIEKTSNMDAYLNHKLNIPCYDLYQQNLSKFNEIFKIAA